jgi:hypothetical protein
MTLYRRSGQISTTRNARRSPSTEAVQPTPGQLRGSRRRTGLQSLEGISTRGVSRMHRGASDGLRLNGVRSGRPGEAFGTSFAWWGPWRTHTGSKHAAGAQRQIAGRVGDDHQRWVAWSHRWLVGGEVVPWVMGSISPRAQLQGTRASSARGCRVERWARTATSGRAAVRD